MTFAFVVCFFEVGDELRLVMAHLCSAGGLPLRKTDELVIFHLSSVTATCAYYESSEGELTPHLPALV